MVCTRTGKEIPLPAMRIRRLTPCHKRPVVPLCVYVVRSVATKVKTDDISFDECGKRMGDE